MSIERDLLEQSVDSFISITNKREMKSMMIIKHKRTHNINEVTVCMRKIHPSREEKKERENS